MEQKAYEQWVWELRPRLVDTAAALLKSTDEAEDVVQETALKLWAMRQQLGDYRSPDALALTIVRRLCLNRLRGSRPSVQQETVSHYTPEAELISHEEAARLLRLMERLPDAQQAVLRMKHLEGMEVAEIARTIGSTAEAVRQNLSRARRQIMKQFKI